MKDHSFMYRDGWYHLYSISGTRGHSWQDTGNEETIAWSMSRDLVNWEFKGHVLHASGWEGYFDQHEVWAPFVYRGPDAYYMFYTGITLPGRSLKHNRGGATHPEPPHKHTETQGIARSTDLSSWVKISDPVNGAQIPGRDSHVVRDDDAGRFLLYSTLGVLRAHAAESRDLVNWVPLGECAAFPELTRQDFSPGRTCQGFPRFNGSESLTVMRHPVDGKWIMLGNWQYIRSDDPLRFPADAAELYDLEFEGEPVDIGFAGEMLERNGKWYRSGTIGKMHAWTLGFTEVAWVKGGAFRIVKPGRPRA